MKNPATNAGDVGDEFNPWVGKIPWRREWLPTSVFLPGESYGQRSLVGYSLWGCKELDTNERLTHAQCVRVNPGFPIYPSAPFPAGDHTFIFYICDSVF